MLYYIYIGNKRAIIDHLSKVTGGMFIAVSSPQKAAKVIDGIRERYNISILYEQTDTPKADCIELSYLRKRYPRVYITLITDPKIEKLTSRQASTIRFRRMPEKIAFKV